jgi:uncharacterized protein (TIGR02301 family)
MKRLSLTALLALSALAAGLVASGAALAQDRSPAERQTLLDLAFTLGETHALRQACEGAGDQYWRARMMRLTDVEKADQAFDAQLRDRFNTGFAARQGEFPACDEASRRAEQDSARHGQALAAQLARSMRTTAPEPAEPDSMADGEPAR